MTIVGLVFTLILNIIIALRSRTFGLRHHMIVFLITLVQVGIIVFYLFVVQPPTMK